LAAIVTLPVVFGVTLPMLTIVVAGFGYVLLAAMTATSSDRAAKWLGTRRWNVLHGFGARYLWLVFFLSYSPRPGLFLVLVLAMPVVRSAAWWKTRESASGA
jgi:hypothetical protein